MAAEFRDEFGYADYVAWTKEEFGLSERSAANILSIHTNLIATAKFAVTDLEQFTPSALYLLAAPSTPEAVREEAVEKAKSGKAPTHKEVKRSAKEKAAPKDKPQKVSVKRVEPEPEPKPASPPAQEPKPTLDPRPWTQHNEYAQRVIALQDEYMELVKKIAGTPFGDWIVLKAHLGAANETKTNFEKWQVVGFKPQWEIGKDGRNFYYAFERAKKGGSK